MKLLCCDFCHNVILPRHGWTWCECKSIGGAYVTNSWMIIARKTKNHQRVIGVQNHVRYGLKPKGLAWIQVPLDKKTGPNLNEVEYNLVVDATPGFVDEIIKEARDIALGGGQDDSRGVDENLKL